MFEALLLCFGPVARPAAFRLLCFQSLNPERRNDRKRERFKTSCADRYDHLRPLLSQQQMTEMRGFLVHKNRDAAQFVHKFSTSHEGGLAAERVLANAVGRLGSGDKHMGSLTVHKEQSKWGGWSPRVGQGRQHPLRWVHAERQASPFAAPASL